MGLEWKYISKVYKRSLSNVEEQLNVKFPDDFRELINDCNAGKPSRECFDILNRKQCVVDYMLGVNDDDSNPIAIFSTKMWNAGLPKDLFPIAIDPFGNIIAYKKNSEQKLSQIIFWNHENGSESNIAESFSIFIKMLY